MRVRAYTPQPSSRTESNLMTQPLSRTEANSVTRTPESGWTVNRSGWLVNPTRIEAFSYDRYTLMVGATLDDLYRGIDLLEGTA